MPQVGAFQRLLSFVCWSWKITRDPDVPPHKPYRPLGREAEGFFLSGLRLEELDLHLLADYKSLFSEYHRDLTKGCEHLVLPLTKVEDPDRK